MMSGEDLKEKQKKAGSPIFILIIFVALMAILFYAPDFFKNRGDDISDLMGGSQTEDEKNKPEEKEPLSAYYQMGSKHSFDFNEISVTDYSLKDGILHITMNTEDTFDLDGSGYYIEFYRNKKTFIGRRTLHGTITKSLPIEIDVSKMNIDTTVYFALSHISDSAIGGSGEEENNTGAYSIVCQNDEETYTYEFNSRKLIKTIYKYTYITEDFDLYADKLLEYQHLAEDYSSKYKGVTASVVENSGAGTFIFMAEYDYTMAENFNNMKNRMLYPKGTLNNVVKFKAEAEGYECS